MKKLLLLLLFVPLVTLAQTTTTKVVNIPGIGNTNFIFYDPGISQPTGAVIFFPGNLETGSDPTKLYINGPLNFIKAGGLKPTYWVIGVQTPYTGGTFNNPAALPFVRGALREITSGRYNIDKSKLILTGLSYGADHVMNYLQHEPDSTYIPIAAAIPMSIALAGQMGSYPNDALGGNDIRFAKLPLWGFCGTSDNFYLMMSHFFSLLTKAGYYNIFTSYAGGHSGWNTYYSPTYKLNGLNIYDWAMQYTVAAKMMNPVHAHLWVDSLIIHYPTTSVLLKDSSTGAASSDILYAVNGNDNTGRFSVGDLSQGILLANLVDGSYVLNLVASDNAGHSDTATATIQVYGPPKCSAPRTVTSIQVVINGLYFTIPVAGTKIGFNDGTTQP